jgi:hypothetical protein
MTECADALLMLELKTAPRACVMTGLIVNEETAFRPTVEEIATRGKIEVVVSRSTSETCPIVTTGLIECEAVFASEVASLLPVNGP